MMQLDSAPQELTSLQRVQPPIDSLRGDEGQIDITSLESSSPVRAPLEEKTRHTPPEQKKQKLRWAAQLVAQAPVNDPPVSTPPLQINTVAVFAGMASVTEAMSQSSAVHLGTALVSLAAHSEIKPAALDFLRLRWPKAEALGPCELATWAHLSPDFAEISFECAPFTDAGLILMEKDPRARQVVDSVEVMEATRPWIALWENVPNFYRKDPEHGLFTQAQERLQPSMLCSEVLYLKDNRMGGCFR